MIKKFRKGDKVIVTFESTVSDGPDVDGDYAVYTPNGGLFYAHPSWLERVTTYPGEDPKGTIRGVDNYRYLLLGNGQWVNLETGSQFDHADMRGTHIVDHLDTSAS